MTKIMSTSTKSIKSESVEVLNLVAYLLPHSLWKQAVASMRALHDKESWELTESERRIIRSWERKAHSAYLLHMASVQTGPRSMCDNARSCAKVCLVDSGMLGIIPNDSQKTRKYRMSMARAAMLYRTLLWIYLPRFFESAVTKEIRSGAKRAAKRGLKLAIRMNGTSDRVELSEMGARVVSRCRIDATCYDYTKVWDRSVDGVHFTYSWQEGVTPAMVAEKIASGASVAFVHRSPDHRAACDAFVAHNGITAHFVNGDEHDARFLDPAGSVIALTAKGPAKKADVPFIFAA